MRLSFSLFLVLLFAATVQAQVPQIFSYQGVLANTDGTALPDGAHTLLVRLYDDPASGDVLWEESHDLQTISGVFSVVLGSKEELNVIFDRPLYLGVTVDGGAEQSPRIPLTASPYSLGTKTTVAEPESGQSFAVRNEEGTTAHVLSVDGSVTHAGKGTFGGGIVVGNPDTTLSKAADDPKIGISAAGTSVGVWGLSDDGTGVKGTSLINYGVFGVSQSEQNPAVYGENLFGGDGVSGGSSKGYGVVGYSEAAGLAGVFGESKGPGGFGIFGAGDTGGIFEGHLGVHARGLTSAKLEGSVEIVDGEGTGTSSIFVETVDESPEGSRYLVWDDDQIVRYRSVTPGSGGVPWTLGLDDIITTGNDVDIKSGIFSVTDEEVSIQNGAFTVAPDEAGKTNSVTGLAGNETVRVAVPTVMETQNESKPTLLLRNKGGSLSKSLEVEGVSIMRSQPGDENPTLLVSNEDVDLAMRVFSLNATAIQAVGVHAAKLEGHVAIINGTDVSVLSIETVKDDAEEDKFLVWDDDGSAGKETAVRYRTLPAGSTCVTCEDGITTIDGALQLTSGGTVIITIDPSSGTKTVEINNPASSLGLGVNAGGMAISGVSASGTGVQGATTDGVGVRGIATGGGMAIDSQGDLGVTGSLFVSEGISVSGDGTNFFGGDVIVNGNLSKGGGEFMIDHPLEPTEKVLRHSFVESPDMMNIYNGNVVLDDNGEASVELPEWFDALNNDFRYQLTCVGGFAPVFVAEKIADNRFKIAGGSAGLEVSWQVTGIRDDPWARMHRIKVEDDKPVDQRGTFLHPEAYGR